MATDTAFAIGILVMLGKRMPATAFAFLTALAIIDDLGAILVIALLYSESISIFNLGISALLLSLLILCNITGIRRPSIYIGLGILVWTAMLNSGIHTTIVGILVAITIPARSREGSTWFISHITDLLQRFRQMEGERDKGSPILGEANQHAVIEKIQTATEDASTPIRRWEHAFEYPVALLILPVFALANAGIPLEGVELTQIGTDPLAVGIFLGLVLGKCVGISFFTWLALRLGFGSLPEKLSMYHVFGLSLLGGMGFTMSIFITNLGFEGMPEALISAKVSILLASLVAGISGYLWLRFVAAR
jgi:NhaA family Na+:H+ antiporter